MLNVIMEDILEINLEICVSDRLDIWSKLIENFLLAFFLNVCITDDEYETKRRAVCLSWSM